ncbi:putative DMT superfamily transporter inner membrane protein [Paraliobacillus sp. PM-2]|uniref:DMT family transporter n=1 Tax=Paraliobacillus sp. PM-2 TaxID=1462524 RepID=UPI00061C6268|nr:DMT family transporter [Paraliobacillus sp. PM-2]CQR46087.1 putative DMT superfamily transporter inner membrane protein [Paraliobacillus sp. PM-2]
MNLKAYGMALTTIIIWGSTFAAIRSSLHGGYTAGHLVLFRYLVASLIFLLYALLPGVTFRLPNKKDAFKILLLGWIGISIYHTGVTFGELTVTAGTAGMFIGSAPVFTALIAVIILKERLGISGWIGLSIGFIGIIIITLGTSGPNFEISPGVWLLLMSACAASVFFVFQKPLLKRYRPIELTAYFTWAGTLPFLLFSPGFFQTVQEATMEATMSAIYVGIFPAAIAYVTWSIALSIGNASSVTSMMYLEPAIAILTAWVWLNEWPSTLSIVGGFVAIGGVIIVNSFNAKQFKVQKKLNEYESY